MKKKKRYRISHYRGHACHHIAPNGGCPKCNHEFCYVCLGAWKRDPYNPNRFSCGNQCPLFCNQSCDCPKCPGLQYGLQIVL